MYVSPSGATTEKDDLVKDLENWFEDHRQMCRLMTAAMPQDGREVKFSLDRLNASLESGQRLLGRLKKPNETIEQGHTEVQAICRRIPLSGVNRFDECRPSNSNLNSGGGSSASLQQSVLSQSLPNSSDVPRVLPSRTYLKKSSGGV
jgi:hypothetical protein